MLKDGIVQSYYSDVIGRMNLAKRTVKAAGGRRFTVVLRAEDVGGYSVQCVQLPQAISQGETREEALTNIKEAIELVLAHLEEKAKAQEGKAEFVEVVV